MATTSKEGSRRVNYSVPKRRGSDDKYRCFLEVTFQGAIGMKTKQKTVQSSNWRASLVPAAAVIPAPRVYIKAVAIKTLVVYLNDRNIKYFIFDGSIHIYSKLNKDYI